MLPWLGILPLLAAGAVLGVLQVRWVGEATRAEEIRVRISLAGSAAQVRSESEDEARILRSLVHVTSAEFRDRDWQQVLQSLRLWYANSRFPRLLREVYIVTDPAGREAALRYARETSDFRPIGAVPPTIGTALAAFGPGRIRDAGPPAGGPPAGTAAATDPGIAVLPVYPRGGDSGQMPLGFMVLDIDKTEYFGTVVPFYMKRNLPGYPYRIYDVESKETLSRSDGVSTDRMPEVAVDLMDPGLGETGGDRPPDGPGGSVPGFLASHSDPFMQSWLQKSRGGDAKPDAGQGPGGGPRARTVLAVYHPKGSLASTMRMQAGLNLGLSLGMLALLLAGIVAISLQYRRTMRLRASEQDFVASVTHELRTPIAVIQATSENLSRGVVSDPARIRRYAEAIYGQVKRLAGMVEGILLYSGLQSGAARRPLLAEVDLASLWEDVVHPLRLLAAEKGSELSVQAAEPRTACGDRTALRLVAENLIVNAVRHASPCRIAFSTTVENGSLRLRVEDDGPGIPAREQARIFEPFVRGERSVKEQHPGSGIGLHLVRRVAGLLGGRVALESPYADAEGRTRGGCRFSVYLPYKERCGNE